VKVAAVTKQDVRLYVEAVGTLDGYANADIRARVKGFLEKQHYQDGATVREGQLLFTIEPTEYQAAVEAAKANLARAQAAHQRNQVDLQRKQSIADSGVVSKQDLDDAEAKARDSEGQVQAAKAAVTQAELNLSYTQIRSPLTGLAGLALVRPGNLVGQEGPTLLTTVSQVDPVRATFPISEIDYVKAPDRIKEVARRDPSWIRQRLAQLARGESADGDSVELILSDGKPYKYRGVIAAANRQVDAGTGTIQLQAYFPNPGRDLRPGQYARVRMRRADEGTNALVVPEKALIQLQGSYSLAVVGQDNKVQVRRVEIGPSTGTVRVVTKGVQAGERVVVDGLQKASDGSVVNPQPAAEQPTASASR
jgi:membrane fusion protein (multidrug efflux system)